METLMPETPMPKTLPAEIPMPETQHVETLLLETLPSETPMPETLKTLPAPNQVEAQPVPVSSSKVDGTPWTRD